MAIEKSVQNGLYYICSMCFVRTIQIQQQQHTVLLQCFDRHGRKGPIISSSKANSQVNDNNDEYLHDAYDI